MTKGAYRIGLLVLGGSLLAAQAEEGFESVFNGTDLSGWSAAPGWAAEAGLLKVVGSGHDLWLESAYESFDLRFDFVMGPGGNSGLFFRRGGLEVQLLDDYADKHADLKEWQYCGSLYGFAGPAERVSKQPGEWQSMAVRLEGQQLTIVLNGVAVVEADLDRIGSHAGFAPGPGRLGFQNYNGSGVRFQNIRIKTL